ncbi:hypothetical protein V2A60_002770 [Cordyceps javanica]
MSSSQSTPQESLQAINNRTLGTSADSFPVVTLPGGDQVPTGTVGALLVNIRAYDAAAAAGDADAQDTLARAIRAAVPVLQRVGMFDLFRPDEWTSDRSQGRTLVGETAAAAAAAAAKEQS